MRAVFIVLGVSGLLCAHYVNAATKVDSHNAIWGARGSRDVLLKRETLKQTFKPLRVVSTDFEFRQKPDRLGMQRTITQIVATDQYTDGDGGHATLTSGGPGLDFAVVHVRSQRGHGYHFVVDIYGQ